MHKPTFKELGADVIDFVNKIGDVANLLLGNGFSTLIEYIVAIDTSIPTKTSDLTNDSSFITSASVPTKTSQLTNDSSFTTNQIARADHTLPLFFEKRTTDPTFDANQAGRVWYRSDLDV